MATGGLHAVVSISRLSAMTGVTARALRHYEQVGLIQPHRTAHGVRLFTPDQCERASLIVLLRRCDVAIEDIRGVLDEASPERAVRLRGLLRQKADELSDKLAGVNAVLAQSFPAARRDAA